MSGHVIADEGIAVRSASQALTYGDLRSDALGLRSQVTVGDSAALCSDDAAVVAAALTALDGWAAEVHLVPPEIGTAHLATDLTVVEPWTGSGGEHRSIEATQPTQWVLYTSGTTGTPKAISHTRKTLTRTVATQSSSTAVWGLLYDPNRMAGLQVIFQSMLSGAQLVAPPLGAPLSKRIAELVGGGVDALSATPTVWRQILQLPVAAGWGLRQITLGGEIADQRLLDALATTFPTARIVHVFASTETGAAFSVKDGREGFPVDYLSEPPRGIPLEIRDGVLHVFSPGVGGAGADGFASTGDMVEIDGDRVLFRGRTSGVVNIGGANVWPEVVETILRAHPDVVEAVVSAKPNPMSGNILVATVTLSTDADPDGVPKRLRTWVRERAPRTHVPASIGVVDDVEMSPTGKVVR